MRRGKRRIVEKRDGVFSWDVEREQLGEMRAAEVILRIAERGENAGDGEIVVAPRGGIVRTAGELARGDLRGIEIAADGGERLGTALPEGRCDRGLSRREGARAGWRGECARTLFGDGGILRTAGERHRERGGECEVGQI